MGAPPPRLRLAEGEALGHQEPEAAAAQRVQPLGGRDRAPRFPAAGRAVRLRRRSRPAARELGPHLGGQAGGGRVPSADRGLVYDVLLGYPLSAIRYPYGPTDSG